ncbi:MAG: YceD family protein [Pseudomonadota bacterium]
MPVASLPKLDDLIVKNDEDEVEFELSFSIDGQGQTLVSVELRGELALQCQRTLKTFRQPIESQSVVAIVASEAQEAELPEDYEVRVCPDQRLELLDLIGEEVLLALPLVPVDPESEPMAAAPEVKDTHRPFEALAEMAAAAKGSKKR